MVFQKDDLIVQDFQMKQPSNFLYISLFLRQYFRDKWSIPTFVSVECESIRNSGFRFQISHTQC